MKNINFFLVFTLTINLILSQSEIGLNHFIIKEKNNLDIGFLSGEINQNIKSWKNTKLCGGIVLAGSITGNRGGFFAFGYKGNLIFKLSKRLDINIFSSVLAGGGGDAPDKDGWLLQTGTNFKFNTRKYFNYNLGISYSYISGGIIKGWSPYFGVSTALLTKDRDSIPNSIIWSNTSIETGLAFSPNGIINFIGISSNWYLQNLKWIGGDLSLHAITNKYGGYMQSLISGGLQFSFDNLTLNASGLIGMGGGGAANVRGGGLFGYQLTTLIDFKTFNFGLKYKNVKPFGGDFKYNGVFLSIGKNINNKENQKIKWSAQLKYYFGENSFSNIGARFVLMDKKIAQFSGSTHWAFTNNMGAYAEGLFDIKLCYEEKIPVYLISSIGAGAGAGINKKTKSIISSVGLGINSPWKNAPFSIETNYWLTGSLPNVSTSLIYNFN